MRSIIPAPLWGQLGGIIPAPLWGQLGGRWDCSVAWSTGVSLPLCWVGRLDGLAPGRCSPDSCAGLWEVMLLKPGSLREVVALFCWDLVEVGDLHLFFTLQAVGALWHTGRLQCVITLTNHILQACLNIEFIYYIRGLALESYGRRMGLCTVWNRIIWKVDLRIKLCHGAVYTNRITIHMRGRGRGTRPILRLFPYSSVILPQYYSSRSGFYSIHWSRTHSSQVWNNPVHTDECGSTDHDVLAPFMYNV